MSFGFQGFCKPLLCSFAHVHRSAGCCNSHILEPDPESPAVLGKGAGNNALAIKDFDSKLWLKGFRSTWQEASVGLLPLEPPSLKDPVILVGLCVQDLQDPLSGQEPVLCQCEGALSPPKALNINAYSS